MLTLALALALTLTLRETLTLTLARHLWEVSRMHEHSSSPDPREFPRTRPRRSSERIGVCVVAFAFERKPRRKKINTEGFP